MPMQSPFVRWWGNNRPSSVAARRPSLTPSGLSEAQGSQFALLGVPVLLEIDYKLVAKMTKRLLECVCRQVSAEGFQRLGLLADRLSVRTRADDSPSDRAFDAPRDPQIHFVGWPP